MDPKFRIFVLNLTWSFQGAKGNPQDLGGWRPVSGPSEVISDAREFLVIDANLLDDAGFHAYAAPPSTTGQL